MPYQQTLIDRYKCQYRVYFTYEAYLKLRAYVLNVQNEVGGLGAVLIDHKNKFIMVHDIFLISQEVTSGTTVLDMKGIAKFYAERSKVDPTDDYTTYKCWWHSHATMPTIWSGVDDLAIEKLDPQTNEESWLLSVVDNHKGELVARLDIFSPFRVTYNNLEWVRQSVPTEMENLIKKEIEEKVRVKQPEKPKNWWNNRNYKKGNGGVYTYQKENDDVPWEEDLLLESGEYVNKVIKDIE